MSTPLDPIRLENFQAGMDNRAHEKAMPPGTLTEIVNLDVDNQGRLARRDGYARVYSGTGIDSLWHGAGLTLFREGTYLKRLNADNTATALASGISGALAYLAVGSEVYYTDGAHTGKIVNGLAGPWGVPRPLRQPDAAPVTEGGMFEGRYQVAITYEAASGEEGGTIDSVLVEVPKNGGILLSNLPQPANAPWIRVYASEANGEVLYFRGRYAAGTPVILLSKSIGTVPLETQFADRPPPGTALAQLNGRIYIASQSTVVFTDALRYGLYHPDKNFLTFPHPVQMLAAVPDGLYVATTHKTYFLDGIDTDAIHQREILPYGAAHGTLTEIPESPFKAWWSEKGFVLAGPEGQTQNLSDERLTLPSFPAGCAYAPARGGLKQLVAVLRDV